MLAANLFALEDSTEGPIKDSTETSIENSTGGSIENTTEDSAGTGSHDTTDTENSIEHFKENWAVNFIGNFNFLSFYPNEKGLHSTTPWAVGAGLRYKKLAGKLVIPISDSSYIPINIEFASYYDAIYYESYIRHYSQFYGTNALDVFDAGISSGWVVDNKQHSLSAVYNMDCMQKFSNGSLIGGIGIYWTSIKSDLELYKNRQHIVYFGPLAGYSYTFIIKGSNFININANLGVDPAININANSFLLVLSPKGKLSIGKYFKKWCVNLVGKFDYRLFFISDNFPTSLLAVSVTLNISRLF